MPEPISMAALAAMSGAQAAGSIGSSLINRIGPQRPYAGGNAIGREEWWQMQAPLWSTFGESSNLARQLTPEYAGYLRQALSGNMGLSPQILQSMFQEGASQLRPEFAQQQDTLASSFSPRMAGSGAQAQAMQGLLGRQAQQFSQLQGGISTQDAMARQQAMMQGLSGFGQMWGGAQGMQSQNASNLLRWLGQ
jgi:hypothetical protein